MIKVINKLGVLGLLAVAFFAPTFGQSAKSAAAEQQAAKTELLNAAKDYKSSLSALATTYDDYAAKSDDKVKQLKGLLDDGLISKRDFDAAVAAAAEAHGKADVTRKQIAAAEGMIVDAQKPIETALVAGLNGVNPSKTAWSTGNARYDALIRDNGARYGVDPYLVFCVMQQESGFSSGITSPAGAQGLMQLMPDTAARFGVSNPMDPAQSISGGTKYLKFLLQMFKGRVDLALASYNAGEGAVLKYGGNIPPFRETVAYVRAIGTKYGILKR